MDLLTSIREGFEHHYWARDRQLQAAAALSEEEFLRPVGGSFPSLRGTLAHMAGAEWVWLERWQGRSPKALPAPEEFPSVAVLAGRWAEIERDVRAFLAGLDAEALDCPLTYANFQGVEATVPLHRLLAHLLNHQSYHRGQVSTLLRLLGAVPPRVDLLVAHLTGFQR